jgi:hypothetical protein
MTNIIPGPGEDGWAMRDEESAAEALDYGPIQRERSDEDDERDYFKQHPDELARLLEEAAESPVITNDESYALHLGARALAEVAAGLQRSGLGELAAESARSATALDDLQRRATVAAARELTAEPEAER